MICHYMILSMILHLKKKLIKDKSREVSEGGPYGDYIPVMYTINITERSFLKHYILRDTDVIREGISIK